MSFFAEFADSGYVAYRMTRGEQERLARLYRAAAQYFARDEAAKLKQKSDDLNVGYRPFGTEYSRSPDRRDLNESFSFWGHNRAAVPAAGEVPVFMAALEAYGAVAMRLTRRILADLGDHYGRSRTLEFVNSSYVQINHYPSMSASRALLQDRHEDGHLFTIHHADSPGLEIWAGGRAKPMEPRMDELIVMPGSVLFLMTGGAIDPLYHQVRRTAAGRRFSIMYFVNPDVTHSVAPYVQNEVNRGVDIRARVVHNPQQFGLTEAKAYG